MQILERFEDVWLRRPFLVAGTAVLVTTVLAVIVGLVQIGGMGQRSVVFVEALEADGASRPLRTGSRVGLDERLRFRYLNPAGHRSLVLLGRNDGRLHLYAPRDPTEPPHSIQLGSAPVVEIDLGPDHRPGPLTIVAAFDQPLEQVSQTLRAGVVPRGSATTTLDIELVPAE